MASLKEVKTRIASVNSTRKITAAMKMVASSKLHRAQQAIESMRPYERQLMHIMSALVSSMEGEMDTPFVAEREVKRVALLLFTSNSSLCGAFNANVVKAFNRRVKAWRDKGVEIARVYPVGKKAVEAVRKSGFEVSVDLSGMLDHPDYGKASRPAEEIMQLYARGEVDRVELIYHHFKSAGHQELREETYLPIAFSSEASVDGNQGVTAPLPDYIVEPSRSEVIAELVPKSLCLSLYTALLDSLASEHAARVIAMQVATDNADELLRELTLTYNKTRQQAITAELLDIVGGSM